MASRFWYSPAAALIGIKSGRTARKITRANMFRRLERKGDKKEGEPNPSAQSLRVGVSSQYSSKIFFALGAPPHFQLFIDDLENQHPLRNVDVGPIRRSSHRQNTDVVANLALESQSDASERHQGFCRVALRHQRAL